VGVVVWLGVGGLGVKMLVWRLEDGRGSRVVSFWKLGPGLKWGDQETVVARARPLAL
jgi:hypothetical protein